MPMATDSTMWTTSRFRPATSKSRPSSRTPTVMMANPMDAFRRYCAPVLRYATAL
jgi:hypothetical protein